MKERIESPAQVPAIPNHSADSSSVLFFGFSQPFDSIISSAWSATFQGATNSVSVGDTLPFGVIAGRAIQLPINAVRIASLIRVYICRLFHVVVFVERHH